MRHAVLVSIVLPAWGSDSDRIRDWEDWLGPLLHGLCGGQPVGLVLQGRWIEEAARYAPRVLAALQDAIASERVELVSTAMHGPALGSIPERDALGQLRSHTTLLKQTLGVRARGGWIPGGVWDPAIPRLFCKAGLGWTTLNRRWLRQHSPPTAPLLILEREGRGIQVLPHDAEGWEEALAVRAVWDSTSATRALRDSARAQRLPSALLKVEGTRAYLPPGNEAGLWERHLLEDAGADSLHKRMLHVSRALLELSRAAETDREGDGAMDPHDLLQARRYLYRAQAAEAYAPTRGKPVSSRVRDRAWRDLIRAEVLIDGALGPLSAASEYDDFDADGRREVRLRTRGWTVTVAPERQGALTEVAWRKGAVNILGGPRPWAFRERWGADTPVASSWELVTQTTKGAAARTVLAADSAIDGVPVRVTKRIDVPKEAALTVRLDVQNRGELPARAPLSTEGCVTLGGSRTGEDSAMSVEVAGGKVPLDEPIELPGMEAVGLIGWRARVELLMSPPARVVLTPQPDGCAHFWVMWPVELWPRDRESREIRLLVREEHHA